MEDFELTEQQVATLKGKAQELIKVATELGVPLLIVSKVKVDGPASLKLISMSPEWEGIEEDLVSAMWANDEFRNRVVKLLVESLQEGCEVPAGVTLQ